MLDDKSGPRKALVFYLVTFALALFVVALSGVLGELSPLVTMLTPALGVLVVMLVLSREGHARSGWSSLGITRAGFKGWWLAILGPIAILLLSDIVLVLLGLASFQAPPMTASGGQMAANIGLGLLIGLFFAFTEEVGWRGYMLPKLAAIGLFPAMLIVGFLHGVWHLPLMLFTPYYHADGNPMIVVPLFLITLSLAGVFYGYLRVWTGSVWPVAIAHAVFNFVWNLGSEFINAPAPETMEYIGGESGILVIAGLIVISAILWTRIRKLEAADPALGAR